jgi:SOS-response transcriptional repressor LexA
MSTALIATGLQPLTKTEQQVLAALRAHEQLAPGQPPTRAELASQLGYRTTAAPNRELQALRSKGWIEWKSYLPRSLRLTPQCRDWFVLQGATAYNPQERQKAADNVLQKRLRRARLDPNGDSRAMAPMPSTDANQAFIPPINRRQVRLLQTLALLLKNAADKPGPSLQDLSNALGYRNHSCPWRDLALLRDKGLVSWQANARRSLRLTPLAQIYLDWLQSSSSSLPFAHSTSHFTN